MYRFFIIFFLLLIAVFSFGQVLTQTQANADIGLDRKAFLGIGNTADHSEGYHHDFTLPASTSACQQITGISVVINITNYTNNGGPCPLPTLYFNLFYGCATYSGGATCLPGPHLIAEPNLAPGTSPPPFNFGNPLGSPLNAGIVPNFGDNLSVDIIPVSNPGCNPVTSGQISYQYTITVTITVEEAPSITPALTSIGPFCSGASPTALSTTQSGITGNWSGPGVAGNSFNPATAGAGNHTLTFSPDPDQCASTNTITVAVTAATTPALTSIGPFCISDAPTTLNTTQSGITGTWTGPGVAGNSFNPTTAGPGNHTLTFTPNGSLCANPNTMTVTVNNATAPALEQIGPFCVSASPTTLNTTQNGITGNWSGPGVSGNSFNPTTAGVGDHTLTFSPDGSQCAIANTITVTINTATSPSLESIGPFCISASPTPLNTIQSGINGNWSGSGVTGNSFNPATAGEGDHTLTFSPGPGQCAIANTITVTVNIATTPALEQIGPFCASAAPTTLNSNQSGINGTWTGPGVAGNSFNPETAGVGNHTLTFSPDVGQCANTNTITVTVNTASTPALTPIGPFCASAAPTALNTTQSGITGNWTGPGVGGNSFNPVSAGAGNHTLTFSPDAGQCAFINTITVTVNPAITPTLTQIGPFCDSAAPTPLSTTQSGITGFWAGPGVSGNSFNPATAGVGIHTITFFPDESQCAIATTISVTVNAGTSPALTPIGPFCVSAAPTTLNTTQNGITGTWTGPGITGNSFNPTSVGVGNHTLTFTPDPGQCAIANTISVTVNAGTSPALTPIGPFCVSAAPTTLNTTQNGITGTWTGPGITGNSFNPTSAGVGNHTLTFTPDPGQCAIANTISVTVNTGTSPVLMPIGPFCVSAAPTTLNTTQNGITGTWTGPGITGNSFNPTSAGVGDHTLTFTPAPGQCAIANTITVTVDTNPTASVPVPLEACILITPPTLISENIAVVLGQITAGNPGLTVNWFFDAAATMPIPNINNIFLTIPPPTTVYATVSNGSCSSSTVPVDIVVSQQPVINPPSNVSACQTYTLPPITGTNLMGNVAYFTGPNGTGTQLLPGDVITSTITLFAYAGSGICADQEQFTITITPPPMANPPGAPLSICDNGTGIGQFNLTNFDGIISGGNGAVNWFTDAGATNPIANPTTYSSSSVTVYATVSNGNCISQVVPVSLQVNPLPIVNLTVAQAISCATSANGAISTNIGNATGPFTFDWNINSLDGQQNPANLGPGTYSLVVTDTNTGCMGTGSITLSAPTDITLNCAQQNPVSTTDGSDGSATVQISGGTAGYTVSWSGAASGSQNQPTAGTATITDLIAGTYNIFVTDDNGCTQTCSFTISSPGCNLSITAVGTNPSCNGTATGSIELTVTGATGDLTFDWNDNTLDGTNGPTGLVAGTYSVTVTDGEGCMASTSVTLTDPAAIILDCTQQNPVSTPDGSDGLATVQISGGTATYTVAWSGAASGSQNQPTAGTTTITDLIAGTYNIVVTDDSGCTQTCSFTIGSLDCNLSVTAEGTNPSCNGEETGSIELTVTGATDDLTFDWNDNTLDGTDGPTGLVAGTYSVTVTDGVGCMAETSVTLTDPVALVLVCTQQSPVSTNGGSDGSATVQISGGTEAYTITWTGAASGSQNQPAAGIATISGLIAGTYNIIVTDDNGCTQTCSFNIGSPNCSMTATVVGTNPGCNGQATGSIALTVTGGTDDLTFDWNDNTLDGIEDPTGLSAGIYSVTITDGEGCTATATATLTDPMAIVLVCAQQNPVSTIDGSDGSATVQISGGTAAYTVTWSGAASGSQNQPTAGIATISGLIAGTYNIIVTDDNGCTQTCSFNIGSSDCDLTASAVGTNPGCNGQATGSIELTVTGETGDLTFEWNDNTLDGTKDPTGLSAGTYSVTITDGTGCMAATSITLSDPAALVLVCTQQNPVSTNDGSDGSATVQISGGTAPYTVTWSGAASGSQNQSVAGIATISGLIAGTYNILVTDENGCSQTCSFIIGSANCNLAATAVGTNPGCNGQATGSIALTVTGETGALTFDWNDNTLDGTKDPTGLSMGAYSVTITDGAGCIANASVVLTEPGALSFAASGIAANCLDPLNGSISITLAEGGIPPYEVSYDGNSFSGIGVLPSLIVDVVPGNYTLTLQDDNDCIIETQVTVSEAPIYTLDLGPDLYVNLGDSVRLEGLANFTIDSVVWTPTEFLNDITAPVTFSSPKVSIAYQLVAFDENGCSAENTVWVYVEQRSGIFIPNAFSPNGDGINDQFKIYGDDKVKSIRSFRVFDRYGSNVFMITNVAPDDPIAGWDGSHRGQMVDLGVYIYFAEIEFFDGHVEKVSGEVTVIR